MSSIRHPAVAGMFYPDDPAELNRQLDQFLQVPVRTASRPKAVIVPHAGYIYSGPVAGEAYAALRPYADDIRRVVLLGPSHRVPFAGIAAADFSVYETPLGRVPVDLNAVRQLLDKGLVVVRNDAHQFEHSLEVHVPFLQKTLGDFSLIPLVVGDESYEDVQQVLEQLWGGPETLIVISSDLSHYHDYGTARAMDERTSRAIEQLHPEAIQYDDACGRIPVGGLLLAARQHGLDATTIDLRNSGDTAGPRDQVVGYGAYVFH